MTLPLTTLKNGLTVNYLHPSDTQFAYQEIFEENTYLQNGIGLTENSIVLDVGANIGLFSLQLAQKFQKIKIYALEPIPQIFLALKKNAQQTHGKVIPCNFGLGDSTQTVNFTFYPNSSTISSMFPDTSKETRESFLAYLFSDEINEQIKNSKFAFLVRLPMPIRRFLAKLALKYYLKSKSISGKIKTLSSFLQENSIPKVDLLKIDAEGSEGPILRGIQEADWPKIRQLVVEIQDRDGQIDEIQQLIQNYGFQTKLVLHPFTRCVQKVSKNISRVYHLYAIQSS